LKTPNWLPISLKASRPQYFYVEKTSQKIDLSIDTVGGCDFIDIAIISRPFSV